jgi:hypothetical protein
MARDFHKSKACNQLANVTVVVDISEAGSQITVMIYHAHLWLPVVENRLPNYANAHK